VDFEKIMPIEDITFSQKQEKLFGEKLSTKLNSKNKLYKLTVMPRRRWSSEY